MRTIALIAASAVLLAANAAWAQPKAEDRRAIQTCLERQREKLGDECIGIVADSCTKAAEAESDKASVCAARELAVWEAELDSALKQVAKGGFAEISRAVTSAQQSWRSSLGALCPIFDNIDPGTLPGGATYCRMQETAHRALILRRLGEAVNEH